MADIGNTKVTDLLKQSGQKVFNPTVTPMSQTNPVNKNNNPTGDTTSRNPLDYLGVNKALGLTADAPYIKAAQEYSDENRAKAQQAYNNGDTAYARGILTKNALMAVPNAIGAEIGQVGSNIGNKASSVGSSVANYTRGLFGFNQPSQPKQQDPLTLDQMRAAGILKDPVAPTQVQAQSQAAPSMSNADYQQRIQNATDYINLMNKKNNQGVLGTALSKAQPETYTVQYAGNPQADLADRYQKDLNARLSTVDQQMANAMKTLQGRTYVDYSGEVRTMLPSHSEMAHAKMVYDTLAGYRNTLLGQSGAVGQTAQNAQINSDSINQRAGIEDKQLDRKAQIEGQLMGLKNSLDPNVQAANMKNTWTMNLVQNMNKLNSLSADDPEYAATLAKQQQYMSLLGLNKQDNEFKTANYEETQYDPVTGAAKSKKSVPVLVNNQGFKAAYNPNGSDGQATTQALYTALNQIDQRSDMSPAQKMTEKQRLIGALQAAKQ